MLGARRDGHKWQIAAIHNKTRRLCKQLLMATRRGWGELYPLKGHLRGWHHTPGRAAASLHARDAAIDDEMLALMERQEALAGSMT